MPMKRKTTAKKRPIEQYEHKDKERVARVCELVPILLSSYFTSIYLYNELNGNP